MSNEMKAIRRVVTGNVGGKSKVLWDGPAPNTHKAGELTNAWTDFWVWYENAAPLSAGRDDGNLKYDFPGPPQGGHLRAVQGRGKPANYDQAKDVRFKAPHAPETRGAGRTWDRGGRNAFNSDMHKTETVDYAILLEGHRNLVLDDGEVEWKPGDIVIDVAAWHQWSSPKQDGIVLYDMFASHFVDGPVGLVQGNDRIMRADPGQKLPAGVKPARRIICLDREPGKSSLVCDAPSPDVRFDPARPGFAWARMWVADGTPAKVAYESLHLPYVMEPPKNGSVIAVVTFPPDAVWQGKVGASQVQAFFRSMAAPGASTYSPQAPHPYMQKMRTLDFAVVFEGEIVLVLDTQEVRVKAGDIVVQLGANHAWSNRSNTPVRMAIISHDGAW